MRSFIFTLALLASIISGYSKENRVNFRTLATAQFEFPELWVVNSGKPVSVAFSKVQPSSPVMADGTNTLNIYKGPLDEKGKPSDTSPTKVALPASSSILLVGWMADEKPDFLAVEDPFTKLKPDDWLIINASKSELDVQIGKTAKPVPVAPVSSKSVKITDPRGNEAVAASVSAKQADGSMKSIHSGYWPVSNISRGVIVIVQKGERLTVSYIADPIPHPSVPKH